MAAVFVQDPIVVPPFPGEAFAKLYGLTAASCACCSSWHRGLCQGSCRGAGGQRNHRQNPPAAHLREDRTSKQTELLHLFMSYTPPVKAA